jgi:CHAT domain-containing protein
MAAETSRMRPKLVVLLASLTALASCKTPPQSAYDNASGTAASAADMPVGQNTAGETCNAQKTATGLDIYCGSWDQPSAHVQAGNEAAAGQLLALATTSPWRVSLEGAYACNEPQPGKILDGIPAEVLACTQRFGGWPHVAFATIINGRAYFGDGVAPALPPLQRAVGVLSGKIAASDAGSATIAASNQVLAQRLAAQAFSSGDISHYEALMSLGSKANQSEDFPSAVIAYRAALALQQKKLGSDNPGTVGPMLELALNLSNQAQYPEAETLFAQAAARAALSSDPTAPAKLLHYQGLDQLNQNHNEAALAKLDEAQAAYAALLPPDAVAAKSGTGADAGMFGIHAQSESAGLTANAVTLNSPVTETALLGIIEVERYRAITLRALGRKAASNAALRQADRIAVSNDIEPPILDARLHRTGAADAMLAGQTRLAIAELAAATSQFREALPGSLPVAETELLQAQVLQAQNHDDAALASCRSGIGLLKNLQLGTSAALITPCLDIFADAASRDAAKADGLHEEMFEAAELAQGSITAQQIAAAAARLASSSSNPKVAAAIRTQQDATKALASLYQQRDQFSHEANGADHVTSLAALDKQIAVANVTVSQADLAVQAAAPNFGQLVQQVVPASAVLDLLRPDEGFLGITSAPGQTWVFLLHDHKIAVARSDTGETAMTGLVAAIKASIEPTQRGLPPFDMKDAQAVYQATLAPFRSTMNTVHELVVAPSGPLLALPFGLLPTKPASDDDLINAPWLIRQTTLAYVPAAANFVSLRKIAATSAATKPWFGFGDFRPVTLAQAQATYSTASCKDSAQLFANLPSLPYAKLELQAAEATFGASAGDQLLGADFTVPNVEKADLKDFRILHFATHALLPTDLPCQNEPAIVTSAPAGAKSADQALLTTGDVANLHLDANLVILSACNTGGGAAGGEALSGLARSFFYAGARALMVTQWSVNDQVSAYLVADTLSRLHGGAAGGAAGSLQTAQLALIQGAGHGFPAAVANPFFWAAFSVIGDGGVAGQTRISALSGTARAGL